MFKVQSFNRLSRILVNDFISSQPILGNVNPVLCAGILARASIPAVTALRSSLRSGPFLRLACGTANTQPSEEGKPHTSSRGWVFCKMIKSKNGFYNAVIHGSRFSYVAEPLNKLGFP
jgi:hypothetical protein